VKKKVNGFFWSLTKWAVVWGVVWAVGANVLTGMGAIQPRVVDPTPTLLGTAFQWFLVAIMVLIPSTGFVVLLVIVKRIFRTDARRIDGSDKNRVIRHGLFWSKTTVIDLDRLHGPGYTFSRGRFTELPSGPYQHEINRLDTMVRIEQATHPGDIARLGYLKRDKQTNPSGGGWRGGRRSSRPPAMPREWRDITAEEEQKKLTASIDFNGVDLYDKAKGSYIPFARDVSTGEVVGIDVRIRPHIAVLGPSGGGKTTVAKSIIFAALSAGFKIVISDCRGMNQWGGGWDQACEVIDSRYPDALLSMMARLNGDRLNRQQLLSEHMVEDIYHLPADLRPKPILFLIDDVGTTIELVKTDGVKKQLDSYFNMLVPASRAEGIHLLASDQQERGEKDWLASMSSNSVSVSGATDRMRGNHGVGYTQAHKMDLNTFQVMGRIVKTPYYEPSQQSVMLTRYMDHASAIGQARLANQVSREVNYDKTEYRRAVEQYYGVWSDKLRGPKEMQRELNRHGVEIRGTQAWKLYNRRGLELVHGKPYEEIDDDRFD